MEFDPLDKPFITDKLSAGMKCLLIVAALLVLAVLLYPMPW